MKILYEWGIPFVSFLSWIALTLILVPAFVRFWKRKAGQIHRIPGEMVASSLGTPLVLLLLGLGLEIFMDLIPPIPAKLEKYGHALLMVLFVLAGYVFLDRLMLEVLRRFQKRLEIVASSEGVIKILYRIILLTFIFLIILDQLKITITPFIASLGIGSVVVGLALQDTLSNIFSWAYVLSNKPIRVGDYISLEAGKEGYVDRIGWRNVRIRLLSNNTLIVPNNKLVNSLVTNFYLPSPELAVLINVGVGYQSDLEKVQNVTTEVAKEVLQETEGAVKEFQPFIRYNAFSESSINFTVILRAKEYADQYLVVHEFIKRLHRRYQSEGIELPYPARTIYMKDGTSKRDDL
ncbi:MAG TPA: mechanosensitive ion channel family protein [Thermodesulfobacteriota bacterium]|nr:mechanosensitive ion channel family protein [Thermodesulfobacteriota bacterium]